MRQAMRASGAFAAACVVLVALACAAEGASPPVIPRPGYCGAAHPIPALKPPAGSSLHLQQVQVTVRHGDRTPAFNHACWADNTAVWECNMTQLQLTSVTPAATTAAPTRLFRKMFEPGAEVLPTGNCGLGQLTTIGNSQQQANGASLRKAYVEDQPFLPASWLDDPDTFHLRSDDVMRTLESAQGLFNGLYPPETDALATNPPAPGAVPVIPFYVEDTDTDTMTYNPTRCPALVTLSAEIMNTTEFKTHLQTVTAPLAAKLSKALGINVPTYGWNNGGLNTKLDCLMTHRCHDFALPAAVTKDLFDAVIAEDTWQYSYHLQYPGFVNLAVGTFLGELWANMQAMIASLTPTHRFASRAPPPSRKPRRMWVYAGHDDGPVMPMMQALGAYHGVWSPYATLLDLELYNGTVGGSAGAAADADGYFVRLIVLGKEVTMPGCDSTLCPIAQFQQLIASLVPTAEQCAGTAPPS